MASSSVAPPPRATTNAARLECRDRYGDLDSIATAADAELAAGRLENAMAMYQLTLASWLRIRWIQHSGKVHSGIRDPLVITRKLQSGSVLDRWMVGQVMMALEPPAVVERRHLDIIAAIVASLLLDTGGKA